MKALEVIPVILIIKYKYLKDTKTEKELEQLVEELIPEATAEFYERFGLINRERFIGS